MGITQSYENAVIRLLRRKAFYAKLIMTMKKDLNFHLPTAGVSVKSTGITLHINPTFFESLSEDEQVGILVHESLHVLHNHTIRFKNFKAGDKGTANIACDIAINQYIPEIPRKMTLTLPNGEKVEGEPASYEKLKEEIPDLLPKMNAEYYFNKIKEEQEKNGGGEEGETIDDHGMWEETDLTPEQIEKMVKGHAKAVYETCSGNEKSEVEEDIINSLYKSEVNWKQQLKQFFANSEETFTESTRKKRNRRYGLLMPGSKNESKLKLGIAVDTSGSVSNEELQLFFGEIDKLYNEAAMVLYVMEADCVIQNCYQYKKNMKIKAKGRGGTFYGAAFDKAKELGVDGLIYFGDMDSSDSPKKPRFNTLWAIVRDQKPPADFGKAIYLK